MAINPETSSSRRISWGPLPHIEVRRGSHGPRGRQWDGYREWGLIPEPGPDGWDEEVVERLIEVDQLGGAIRSLPRRLLVLSNPRYSRTPALTRRAMQKVIPTIRQPIRKMERMQRAHVVRSSGPSPRRYKGAPTERPVLRARKTWAAALDEVPEEHFGRLAHSGFYFADALVAAVAGTADDISDIPREEQLILVAVIDAFSYIEERAARERRTRTDDRAQFEEAD